MADDDKTFTQADVDKLMADLNAKHQEDMNALAGKLRAEFKNKEAKAKAEAEKLAKQANCPYSCDMTISNQTMTNICPLYLKQFLLPVFLLFRYFLQH